MFVGAHHPRALNDVETSAKPEHDHVGAGVTWAVFTLRRRGRHAAADVQLLSKGASSRNLATAISAAR